MLMATSFLQNDALIQTFNLPYLFVIGIATSVTFCRIYFLDILLACFQFFEAS